MYWKIYACLLVTSTILQSAVTYREQTDEGGWLDFDKPHDYPREEEINEHLKNYGMPTKPDYNKEELHLIEDEGVQSILYGGDDEMNCRTEVHMLKPFKLTYENRSYPVIQSKYFSQRIRNVSCKDLGEPCFEEISINKNSYKATCETEKGSIQLYVLDGENVVPMPASFNCCCKCTIKERN